MANLTVYTDRAVRSAVAKQFLSANAIDFTEVSVENNAEAVEFLESQGRDLKHFPCPQFYVNETLVWANGFKDLSLLTTAEINSRIEELNA